MSECRGGGGPDCLTMFWLMLIFFALLGIEAELVKANLTLNSINSAIRSK